MTGCQLSQRRNTKQQATSSKSHGYGRDFTYLTCLSPTQSTSLHSSARRTQSSFHPRQIRGLPACCYMSGKALSIAMTLSCPAQAHHYCTPHNADTKLLRGLTLTVIADLREVPRASLVYLAEAGLRSDDNGAGGPQPQRPARRVHQALRGCQVQNDAAGDVQGVHGGVAESTALGRNHAAPSGNCESSRTWWCHSALWWLRSGRWRTCRLSQRSRRCMPAAGPVADSSLCDMHVMGCMSLQSLSKHRTAQLLRGPDCEN